MNEKYFFIEEYSVGQSYISFRVTGIGKHTLDDALSISGSMKFSPFVEVWLKAVNNNKEYNQYLKVRQKQGSRINYLKTRPKQYVDRTITCSTIGRADSKTDK